MTAGGLLSTMGEALVVVVGGGGVAGWHRSKMDGVAVRDRGGNAGEEVLGLVVGAGARGAWQTMGG